MSSQNMPDVTAENSDKVSALGPVDPCTVSHDSEEERSAPWIVRKLYGSIPGRIVMSSYESFRATGNVVICLSPWGDSSPVMLPCIRFRDIVVHTVITATGGVAALASPIMSPVSDIVIGIIGDSIIVEGAVHLGSELSINVLDDLAFEKPLDIMIPFHDSRFATTKVKSLLITLKFQHTIDDASLGFFRSSIGGNPSLFCSVRDYLGVEKGWFCPYLFSSGRRPIIPRSMTPDVIFCHGPFLSGDYRIGEILLAESALTISFCAEPLPAAPSDLPSPSAALKSAFKLLPRESLLASPSTAEPPNQVAPSQQPPPRRMVIVLISLKPHRTFWTTSARPSESVIYYQLLDGVPAIVLPVKPGAPLVSWHTLTLEQLWKIDVRKKEDDKEGIWGVLDVLSEYLEFCVDFDRVIVDGHGNQGPEEQVEMKRMAIRNAMTMMIVGAVRCGESKEVRKEVDKERSGLAMWRIP